MKKQETGPRDESCVMSVMSQDPWSLGMNRVIATIQRANRKSFAIKFEYLSIVSQRSSHGKTSTYIVMAIWIIVR